VDRRAAVVLSVVWLSLLGTSCADTTDPGAARTSRSGTQIPTSGEPAAPSPSASEVPEVLDFQAPLLDGGTFRGASLTGKDVAFWFWAPW
jgi:hypothetical protein